MTQTGSFPNKLPGSFPERGAGSFVPGVQVVPATLTHADMLAFYMPAEHRPLMDGIKDGIRESSPTWCALNGPEVLCVGGIRPRSILLGEGYVWQLSQPNIRKHRRELLRQSALWKAAALSQYRVLTGLVTCDDPSLRWLAWLGFSIDPPYEVEGAMMRRIELCR